MPKKSIITIETVERCRTALQRKNADHAAPAITDCSFYNGARPHRTRTARGTAIDLTAIIVGSRTAKGCAFGRTLRYAVPFRDVDTGSLRAIDQSISTYQPRAIKDSRYNARCGPITQSSPQCEPFLTCNMYYEAVYPNNDFEVPHHGNHYRHADGMLAHGAA